MEIRLLNRYDAVAYKELKLFGLKESPFAFSEKSSLRAFYEKFGFRILGGLVENDLIIEGEYVNATYRVNHLKTEKR